MNIVGMSRIQRCYNFAFYSMDMGLGSYVKIMHVKIMSCVKV